MSSTASPPPHVQPPDGSPRRGPTARVPSRRARAIVALLVAAAAAAAVVAIARGVPGSKTDFDHVWYGARALVAGRDPYAAVGPGRAFDWAWPLYYPVPALLVLAPLAWLPLVAARATFAGLSAGALAYGATRDGYGRLLLFLSGSYAMALTAVQWSPLLTAAYFLPALAWVWVAKPNIGAAVVVAPLARRTVVVAATGALALGVLSLVVAPGWPRAWLAEMRTAPHFMAPVRHWGGPLLLLALLRWRRPEARLLVALACVPHTTLAYETLPLFAVPKTRAETLALTVLSWPAWLSAALLNPNVPLAKGGSLAHDLRYAAYVRDVGDVALLLLYLPCLVMVLRRPNEGPVPAWLEHALGSVRARVARRAAPRATGATR